MPRKSQEDPNLTTGDGDVIVYEPDTAVPWHTKRLRDIESVLGIFENAASAPGIDPEARMHAREALEATRTSLDALRRAFDNIEQQRKQR